MNLFRKLFFILLLVLISLVVLFFSQRNNVAVPLDLIFFQIKAVSVWFLAFVSFLFGSLFTVLVLFLDIIKVNVNERRLVNENKRLQKEIGSIRNQTIDDVNAEEDISEEEKEETNECEDEREEDEDDEIIHDESEEALLLHGKIIPEDGNEQDKTVKSEDEKIHNVSEEDTEVVAKEEDSEKEETKK